MTRRFPCPRCRSEMLLERMHEGFEVPCPACAHRFLVPRGSVPDAPSAPAAHRPSYPPPRRAQTDDGTSALVAGIVACAGGLLCAFLLLLGPVAWVLGHRARQTARAAGVEPSGAATAGWVMGIVATVLAILGAVAITVMVGIMAARA